MSSNLLEFLSVMLFCNSERMLTKITRSSLMCLGCILHLFIENSMVTTLMTPKSCWFEDKIKTN